MRRLASCGDTKKVKRVTSGASRRSIDKYLPCTFAKSGCLPTVRHTQTYIHTRLHTFTHTYTHITVCASHTVAQLAAMSTVTLLVYST